MDEQEKCKGEMQRVTHDKNDDVKDRSQPHPIPLDLMLEILSRLPAQSIGRSRCVSKLWSSFSTLQRFINSYATRSSARPPSFFSYSV
ncbi:putative F-box protein [Cardamine amara subsp. amara]|uniref:F-box protein n=1 Tax=Cardamine amara subsp. amara TaxID=228776 RepID=A0ABD0ZNG5_CARAN